MILFVLMLIVLDYDETYTVAPALWDGFIVSAQQHGHTVVCCTMRSSGQDSYNGDVISDMGRHGIPIVYAADYRDKWEAMQGAGFTPENAIWIDDRPMYIFMNRAIDELPD
ncbi:MAG: hypothetical protein ACU843_16975 [Gammaproteobacteria bacterium]